MKEKILLPGDAPVSGSRRGWSRLETTRDLALLAGLALLVRLAYARAVSFPPLDDPAYAVKAAMNLQAGRGLTIAVLWNYLPSFPAIEHPAFDYWMPLPSLLMAVVFALTGPSLAAAQVPGLLAGTALPSLAYAFGRRMVGPAAGPGERYVPLLAGLLLAVTGTVAYQAASMDSAALFAVLAAGALLLSLEAANRERGAGWAWLGVGLLTGLAFLTRSPGLLVLPAAWLSLGPRSGRGRTAIAVACSLLGTGLVVIPWLLRNDLAFGFLLSPTGALAARAHEYADLFRYGDPAQAVGWGPLTDEVSLRARAGWHAWRAVLDFALYPTAFPALVGLLGLGLTRPPARGPLAYTLLLPLLLAAAFPVTVLHGSYYHSVGSSLPFLAVGYAAAIAWVARRPRRYLPARRTWSGPLALVALALIAAPTVLAYPVVASRHAEEGRVYREVAAWLIQHEAAAVMASQPATVNYVADLPAARLPAAQEPAVVRQAACRYGAEYLVLTERDGLYPEALQVPTEGFSLAEAGDGYQVFAIACPP